METTWNIKVRQFSTDETHTVLWQAVQHHQVARFQVIADQNMACTRDAHAPGGGRVSKAYTWGGRSCRCSSRCSRLCSFGCTGRGHIHTGAAIMNRLGWRDGGRNLLSVVASFSQDSYRLQAVACKHFRKPQSKQQKAHLLGCGSNVMLDVIARSMLHEWEASSLHLLSNNASQSLAIASEEMHSHTNDSNALSPLLPPRQQAACMIKLLKPTAPATASCENRAHPKARKNCPKDDHNWPIDRASLLN